MFLAQVFMSQMSFLSPTNNVTVKALKETEGTDIDIVLEHVTACARSTIAELLHKPWDLIFKTSKDDLRINLGK